jgi:hypothetical protein
MPPEETGEERRPAQAGRRLHPDALKRRVLNMTLDAHRLSEFIYGTVTGLVALAGIDASGVVEWWKAMLVVVSGAVAIWLAHAYAMLISHQITDRGQPSARAFGQALESAWPVVMAGLTLAVPLLGVGFELYGLDRALLISSGLGVVLLTLMGVAAGAAARASWIQRLALILLSCGLGLLVVAVGLAVHHH